MIGEAEIRAMKPGSFLINNARGTVVDLDALASRSATATCAALRSTCSRRSRARIPSLS